MLTDSLNAVLSTKCTLESKQKSSASCWSQKSVSIFGTQASKCVVFELHFEKYFKVSHLTTQPKMAKMLNMKVPFLILVSWIIISLPMLRYITWKIWQIWIGTTQFADFKIIVFRQS